MENDEDKKSAPEDPRARERERVFDILLVEDHVQLADATRHVLEALGHRVRVAALAHTAIAEARLRSPDCVLIDLRLPDMGGYELGSYLRRKCQLVSAALVVLTADARFSSDVSRLDEVFDLVLTKPLDPVKLVQWLSTRADRGSSH